MLTTILIFIAILGFLVLVHELGHFIVARKMGIAVDEFALGFPPRLLSKKHKGTAYSLNLIPIGGYVKIKGENGEQTDEQDSFAAKKVWQRILVVAAGVTMNVIAGWVILSALLAVGASKEITPDINPKYIKSRQVTIVKILANSPAAASNLQAGDIILSLNGKKIDSFDALRREIGRNENKLIDITYQRGNDTFNDQLTPTIMPQIDANNAGLGVGTMEIGKVRFPIHLAIANGAKSTYYFMERILSAFGGIIKSVALGNGLGDEIGGPVAIAVITNGVAKQGLSNILIFTAILSFNLAIINILPFPALDGGRIIFLLMEKIRGKPSRQEVEGILHRLGFALLILFAIFITYRDIARFGGQIWSALIN